VGFGSIGELPGPFPGYTAAVPKSCAPFARVLRDNGYAKAIPWWWSSVVAIDAVSRPKCLVIADQRVGATTRSVSP